MSLQKLGWNSFFDALFINRSLVPARVIVQGGDRYIVHDGSREMPALVRGRLREQAAFPPVAGDWVGLALPDALQGSAESTTIEEILERRTAIVRKRAGRTFGAQVLAANIDRALLVMALDQDFSLRRLERYLTLVWESGATPVIILRGCDFFGAFFEFHSNHRFFYRGLGLRCGHGNQRRQGADERAAANIGTVTRETRIDG